MTRSRWHRVSALLTEILFPGRCLSCGSWLLFSSNHLAPICDLCLRGLPRFHEPRCEKCGIELISEKGSCMRCRSAEYTFCSNMSLFPYVGSAKGLLQSFKFDGRARLAGFFAEQVTSAIAERGLSGTIVPVPPRPGRIEPDSTERVIRALERDGAFAVKRLLVRRAGPQQKSLDLQSRRQNLKGRLGLASEASSSGVPDRVILLDDVFTTGATIDACARVLREAGCAAVHAVTLVMEQ